MKRTIILILLAVASVGVTTQILPLSKTQPLPTIARPIANPSVESHNTSYASDRFGFRITYPRSYRIAPSASVSTQLPRSLEVLELWNQAEYPDRTSLPETPPLITITVYDNTQQLPLSAYKGDLSHNDDRPLTVGGQNAIAYTSTGLYEFDHVLLSSPDGRYVLRLSGSYIDANAPIRQDFQDIVSSLTFNELPSSDDRSKLGVPGSTNDSPS